MSFEEPEAKPNPISDHNHIMNWLESSDCFLTSLLDDPYNSDGINDYRWWGETQQDIGQVTTQTGDIHSPNNNSFVSATTTTSSQSNFHNSNHLSPPSNLSTKIKHPDDPSPKPSKTKQTKKNQNSHPKNKDDDNVQGQGGGVKRSLGPKKGTSKGNGNPHNNGTNKDERWAEQLLNPCALAITAGNLNRVQHLLYVLHELASPTGDANHRLAAYGLRTLIQHLSSSTSSSSFSSSGPRTFASTEPGFFKHSLLRFYELSPWFAFPNNIANASILQVLAQEPNSSRVLHIIDIGVSHGVQWPTLLEALTSRSGGPPPVVRLTVIAASGGNSQITEPPFSVGPSGDNFSSKLLASAKFMNINLQINVLHNQPLQNLTAQTIDTSPDEILIVCAQFRVHHLNHNSPDERTEFLRVLRRMEPKGVILCENNAECSCNSCGDFATGFSRRVEFLWKFLDSTSTSFKGRDSDERRVMEGEAAKALTNRNEMNEVKEKWCGRMKAAGFVGEMFGVDATDGAGALLRKYDSNWKMSVDENDKCIGLWWKGLPISFCSLWRVDTNVKYS